MPKNALNNSYAGLSSMSERYINIVIGFGGGLFMDSSFTIEVYHKEDTMSVKFINPYPFLK